MAFRRRIFVVLSQVLLFACGGAALSALWFGLYANVAALVLIAAWITAETISRRLDATETPSPPSIDMTALEVERGTLRSWIEQTPAPLVVMESDGGVRAANRAARALFGADDRLTDPPAELVSAMLDLEPGARRTVSLTTGGAIRTYALSIADVQGVFGRARLAALVDIQPEIQAAEATALRELLQVLSHEIMNSLTPVASLGSTAHDLLETEASENAMLAREAIGTLVRRAEGLTHFVDAYRTLARLPPPDLKRTSLHGLIGEVARLFEGRWTAHNVTLEIHSPEQDALVLLDANLMIQALINILGNGAEAALAGEHAEAPWVRLSILVRGHRVTLMIEDNGAGVKLPDPTVIFRPFFTAKSSGSGVGLSLAHQVILGHGGDLIIADPVPGQGARLIATF